MDAFKTIDIRDPNTFVFMIGAMGISSQIPDKEQWRDVPTSLDGGYVFVKEFQLGYDAAAILPSMHYWLLYGMALITVGVPRIFTMAEVVAEHGEKAVTDLLWRMSGTYRNPKWIGEQVSSYSTPGDIARTVNAFTRDQFVPIPPTWKGTPFQESDYVNPHVVTPDQVGIYQQEGETLEGEYTVIDREV